MIPSRFTAAIVCLCIAGCGGGCGSSTETVDDDPTVGEASGGETTPPREPEAVVDPGPAPTLRVIGEPDAHSRGVSIRIENRGDAVAEVAGTLSLQRQRGETWADEESAHLDLRYSCEDEAAECVTLAPGATYIPPEWLGTIGDAQCICTRCAAAEAGTYRFVVRSCNGAHTVEGEPFDLR